MEILHIITGLNDGGAEAVLYRLCLHDKINSHAVVSLSNGGKYGPMLRKAGFSVHILGMRPARPSIYAFFKLRKLIAKRRPDIVQTWMYHSNLFGGVAARVSGIRSIVWNIRQTTFESGESKIITRWIGRLLATLSCWLPSKIIVCAQEALDKHVALGYDRRKMICIPNGYDLKEFQSGLDPQSKFRFSLNAPTSIPLIGTVGRFDPQKDHLNLLDALFILSQRGVLFRCLLVGVGLDETNSELLMWISERGLIDSVHLLGQRTDIPFIMNALDLHVLPSAYGEAFPNVVAEAMACGTPCVVTEIGDAGFIVGRTGWVVPPRDSKGLAAAIQEALSDFNSTAWVDRCNAARTRIEENFSIDSMVQSYNAIWQKVRV